MERQGNKSQLRAMLGSHALIDSKRMVPPRIWSVRTKKYKLCLCLAISQRQRDTYVSKFNTTTTLKSGNRETTRYETEKFLNKY